MARTLIALMTFLAAVASPAFAGPAACMSKCAAQKDGREAACRVKSGSDRVKACIDRTNLQYHACRSACARRYNIKNAKPAQKGPSTQPGSTPSQEPSGTPSPK